jgi:hypothetical protein
VRKPAWGIERSIPDEKLFSLFLENEVVMELAKNENDGKVSQMSGLALEREAFCRTFANSNMPFPPPFFSCRLGFGKVRKEANNTTS